MDIGPLEYIVIGFHDDHFTNEILPELKTLQRKSIVRVVDLTFVHKNTTGTAITIQSIDDLAHEEQQAYVDITTDLMGLLTIEDVKTLAEEIPPAASAVIILLEHTWTQGLSDAIQRAGAVLYTGRQVTPDAVYSGQAMFG